MTLPGQGGKPHASSDSVNAFLNLARSLLRAPEPRASKPVVLVGPHRLLAAPLRSHHEQAPILLDRRRRGKLENLGYEIAVQGPRLSRR